MRNSKFLDNPRPEDKLIGELNFDENGSPYRMINGRKIYQLVNCEEEKDKQLIINRVRATGLAPSEYLKKYLL